MITVRELNEKIKAILEATFMAISVEGEVGSVTYHSSGHLYFTIKDDSSAIKCVMWRSNVKKLKFKVEQGEHIVLDASIGVYAPRGEYQLIATKIEPYGKGALSLAFEQLKSKLEAKGYFNKDIKKDIPKFPKKIAIVTALGGAGLQDMLKVASNRWALSEIVVIDVLVQGEAASKEIAKAIEYADSLECDVIVASRGGGSQEDLWAFNEEIVADAIFKAKTPIVSAVGHEVDFLISDFVADLRAPTPSAAMEMILPDFKEYLLLLDDMQDRLKVNLNLKLKNCNETMQRVKEQLNILSPIDRLKLLEREFNSYKLRLKDAINYKISIFNSRVEPLESRAKESIKIQLKNRETKLKILKEHLLLTKEQRAIKKGFVEVIKDGKRTNLCELKEGESIYLVSNKCKVEVTLNSDVKSF